MTFIELQQELKNRLSIVTPNTFYTDVMLKDWLNQANLWACGFAKWAFTEKAEFTESRANTEHYDYPVNFKADSIRMLEIEDNGFYKKLLFKDFQEYKGSEKVFSDFRRRFFVKPILESAGKKITVWGQEKPTKLVGNDDITPFAEGEEMGEEAIIKRALMTALQKAKKYQEARVEGNEARAILQQIQVNIIKEQGLYQTKDAPLFEIPDYLK